MGEIWLSFREYLGRLFSGWYRTVTIVFFLYFLAAIFFESLRPGFWFWVIILLAAFLVAQFLAFHDVRRARDAAVHADASVEQVGFAQVRVVNLGPPGNFKVAFELPGRKGLLQYQPPPGERPERGEEMMRHLMTGEPATFGPRGLGPLTFPEETPLQIQLLHGHGLPITRQFLLRQTQLGVLQMVEHGEEWPDRDLEWRAAVTDLRDKLTAHKETLDATDDPYAAWQLMQQVRSDVNAVPVSIIGQTFKARVNPSMTGFTSDPSKQPREPLESYLPAWRGCVESWCADLETALMLGTDVW